MYIMNNLKSFHLPPHPPPPTPPSPFSPRMNKELNIRIFRLWPPGRKKREILFSYVLENVFVYLTMLQRRVALGFFNAMAKKMVELDFWGGFFFWEGSPLNYLKHYSNIDICCSCLITFMLNFNPPPTPPPPLPPPTPSPSLS